MREDMVTIRVCSRHMLVGSHRSLDRITVRHSVAGKNTIEVLPLGEGDSPFASITLDFNSEDESGRAEVSHSILTAMIRDVAAQRPDAIGVICTNLKAAPLVAALEQETGIPIYDTIATVVWKSLKLVGVDPSGVTGWGRVFKI